MHTVITITDHKLFASNRRGEELLCGERSWLRADLLLLVTAFDKINKEFKKESKMRVLFRA